VVIQADKSRPSPPANSTALSPDTNVAKAGRVTQRSSGELPVVGTIPEYPTFALQTNVQGRVVLKAIIDTDGTLHNVRLLSPSSMLDSTVLDAVKKWRYQPHLSNGKPVEVETQITVEFSITTE
jgi:protein TonB